MKSEEGNKSSVAIIGMALRYSGAQTLDEYWNNICNNVDALHVATDQDILDAGVNPDRLKIALPVSFRMPLTSTHLCLASARATRRLSIPNSVSSLSAHGKLWKTLAMIRPGVARM
jgi:hypothetical protein